MKKLIHQVQKSKGLKKLEFERGLEERELIVKRYSKHKYIGCSRNSVGESPTM